MPITQQRNKPGRKQSFPTRVKDALSVLIGQEYGGGNAGGANSHRRTISVQAGQPITISRDFLDVAVEGFNSNPWINKGIRIIVDAAGDVTIKVTHKERAHEADTGEMKVEWKDVGEHQLVTLLERPNEKQSWRDFQEMVLLHLNLAGNAFIHRAAPLQQLTVLRPDLVEIIPDDKGDIDYYKYKTGQSTQDYDTYQPDEVCHLMFCDPINPFDGIAPAEAAAMSINLNNVAREWNHAKLKNTVGISGAFFSDALALNENQQQQIEEKIMDYTGPQNAGKYALLDGVKDYKPLADSSKEMDWFNIMELSAHEISMAIGVPKELLWGEATFENLDQAKRQLYIGTVLPQLGKIIDGLNHFLSPLFPDYRFELDTEAIEVLQENFATKAQWVLPLIQNRTILVNEGREKLGWEAREDCNLFLEPVGLSPIEPDGAQPQGGVGITPPQPAQAPTPVGSPGNGNAPSVDQANSLMTTLEAIKQKAASGY
jgi:HK97 family phage portal protein